jgi:hypothetical protein
MNRLTFLGDVYLPRAFRVTAELTHPYVLNLEHPITSAAVGWPGKINLKAEQNHIPATFGRLPAAVCLANNHIMDFGPDGVEDTLRELERAGIPAFGVGSLANNCRNPHMLAGGEVALLGYACPSTAAVFATPDHAGAAPLVWDRVIRDIDAARSAGARRVIVSLHWGEEHVPLPKPSDVALGRRIVDAGADLVIGHHAHCIQSFERYRDRHIFYGLGNCITPNVDQPSFFDEQGQSTRRVRRTQQWWNKRSLAVDYNVATGDVDVRELHFDGKSLRSVRARRDRYRLRVDDLAEYERTYRRAFAVGKLRNKVMAYLSRPRLPRPRHLRSLLAISREVRSPEY